MTAMSNERPEAPADFDYTPDDLTNITARRQDNGAVVLMLAHGPAVKRMTVAVAVPPDACSALAAWLSAAVRTGGEPEGEHIDDERCPCGPIVETNFDGSTHSVIHLFRFARSTGEPDDGPRSDKDIYFDAQHAYVDRFKGRSTGGDESAPTASESDQG